MADPVADTVNALIEAVEAIEHELGVTPSSVYSSVRVRLDVLEARINNPLVPSPTVDNPFIIGNSGVTISTGNGEPTANETPGSLYLREDGYTGDGLYAKRVDGNWYRVDTNPFYHTRKALTFPSDANYTISQQDCEGVILEFSGTISSNRDVIVPNLDGFQWTIFNVTTGGFNITVKISGQTGVTIANNKRAIVYCNGSDVVRVTIDV